MNLSFSDDPNMGMVVMGNMWDSLDQGSDSTQEWWTLAEITRHLRSVYAGRIAHEVNGVKFEVDVYRLCAYSTCTEHSPSKTERLWFSHLLESGSLPSSGEQPITIMDAKAKRRIHELLARSEVLDNFLQLKFPNLKRYGLEGGESMLPALDSLFSSASHGGIQHIIFDLLQYPVSALFNKIKGGSEIPEELGAEGDVLSHLVASPSLDYGAPNSIKVSHLPNPSHLEAVNPIALGKTRAKRYALLRTSPAEYELGDKVICVQLPGHASFAGQGVVMEGLGLTSYGMDVNADMDWVLQMSYALWISHSAIESISARHNELDLPSITSPLMYEKISARRSVPQIYEEKLKSEETPDAESIASVRDSRKSHLGAELVLVPEFKPTALMLEARWGGMAWPASEEAVFDPKTGVRMEILRRVGRVSVAVPENFGVHPKLLRHIKNRLKSIESGIGIDWATAEALAFGSLMQEGCDVRISGQDVGTGTFSQRHAMLVDQRTEGVVVPLNEDREFNAEGRLELANSSLSEMAVLGFEYGASWERPNILPMWEAQFGDFFNGAQVIINTYLVSAETKWLKQSGIVMLLPHGLDGAGPEHSSSCIERMLQLSDAACDATADSQPENVNIHVAFPTTPAQYFHLLRRRNFRKPRIVARPKALFRLSAASSSLSDLGEGTAFKPVLDDPIADASQVKCVVLLSGKIYYDLIKHRDAVAFIRLEELSPFPFKQLMETQKRYTAAREFIYLQGEPRNQGAYTHVASRIQPVFEEIEYTGALVYRGRKESALPAPGIGKLYGTQQKAVVDAAFDTV
ncbi:hypothetical protein DXG01_000968 [Tephrocybe rancida]|nr:hypothetical protein DXG01_000968 [Tephrocybe rancida]